LFFSCSAFFAMRRQKWVLAGILGGLAALTRSAGILLVLPYIYEIWITRDISLPGFFKQLKGQFTRVLPIVLIPSGIFLYSLYCWKYFHNPIAFVMAETGWNKTSTAPWYGIISSLWQIFIHQPFGSFMEVHNLLDLSATLSFIALTI